jgi:hypothetical protein
METINLLVTYDTSTHAYTLEDSSDEENAELLSWIEGVPRLADDPDGISQKDLEALWGLNEGGGQKRVKKLIATTLLRQSDDLVKVGRGRERRYWRADFDVRHGPTNRDTTDELAVGISVDGETGVTAPKGRSHARGTEIPRYEGIGGIPVVGGDEPSVKGQRATKGKA